MFNSNPWGDYLTVLAPLIAGYYLFIGVRFYSREIKARMSGRRNDPGRFQSSQRDFDVPVPPTFAGDSANEEERPGLDGIDDHLDQQPASWQNEELFDQVERLAVHLKDTIEEAHEKDYGKQDLILLLQMTLKEYPALREAPFQTAINNLIETECAKYGSIHLREEDKVVIWKQV